MGTEQRQRSPARVIGLRSRRDARKPPFADDRRPPPDFWAGRLVASRLLEYELWTRHELRGRREGRLVADSWSPRAAASWYLIRGFT